MNRDRDTFRSDDPYARTPDSPGTQRLHDRDVWGRPRRGSREHREDLDRDVRRVPHASASDWDRNNAAFGVGGPYDQRARDVREYRGPEDPGRWRRELRPGDLERERERTEHPSLWDRVKGVFAGVGPRNYRRPDERIREDVCERLTYHPYIDASEVEVEVRDGEVTLSGTVDDRQAKRLAEDVADDVRGVRDVHNRLQVRRHPERDVGGVGQTQTPGTTAGLTGTRTTRNVGVPNR